MRVGGRCLLLDVSHLKAYATHVRVCPTPMCTPPPPCTPPVTLFAYNSSLLYQFCVYAFTPGAIFSTSPTAGCTSPRVFASSCIFAFSYVFASLCVRLLVCICLLVCNCFLVFIQFLVSKLFASSCGSTSSRVSTSSYICCRYVCVL